jgi:hypothetical protein
MPATSERSLFVENTILIWLLTMPASVQARIRQALQDRLPISSTFVKAEYINTYLRAAIAVFNLIADTGTLAEAHRKWQADFRCYSKLEVHHFITVLLADEKTKEGALRRLRQVIDTSVWLHFNETISCVSYKTDSSLLESVHGNGSPMSSSPWKRMNVRMKSTRVISGTSARSARRYRFR